MTHKNTHRKKIKINILGSGRHENLRATSKICGLHEQLSLLRQVTFLALKGYNIYCQLNVTQSWIVYLTSDSQTKTWPIPIHDKSPFHTVSESELVLFFLTS